MGLSAQNQASVPPTPRRVIAYCHDSVGLGHLRRTTAICEAVGRQHPGASFLLATGTPYFPLFDQVPRVDYIKLPALQKFEDGSYGCKYLNVAPEQLMRCRESLLEQAARSFDPHLILVDKAPLGVCRELLPTLRWIRTHKPDTRVVFGMRDIEDDPRATIREWKQIGVPELIEECFDEVWVYGMQDVFDPVLEYQLSERIQERLHYMGYVARPPCSHGAAPSVGRREVLVTVGGGTDGEVLLDRYLSETAEAVAAMGNHSTIVGGPDLPKEAADRLRRIARRMAGVDWLDFAPCMSCRIRQADLVVAMGGYNTLCEIVVHAKPALIIPRVRPRLEQAIRAELWEQRGAVHQLVPAVFTAETLTRRVVAILRNGPASGRPNLDLGGLARVAARFGAFWREETTHAAAVRL